MSDQSLYLLTEAAERTGLTVEAIRQRVKRGKLEAIKGNDGLLRVRLTTADLAGVDRSATGRMTPTMTGQTTHDDQLNKALQDAAEARGEATALRQRAERAEAVAIAERARAAQAEREREAARIAAAAAEAEGKALREALAREMRRLEQAEADRQAAETQRDVVRAIRDAALAERDAARGELADWTAGGPIARAWRALIYRRGRS